MCEFSSIKYKPFSGCLWYKQCIIGFNNTVDLATCRWFLADTKLQCAHCLVLSWLPDNFVQILPISKIPYVWEKIQTCIRQYWNLNFAPFSCILCCFCSGKIYTTLSINFTQNIFYRKAENLECRFYDKFAILA